MAFLALRSVCFFVYFFRVLRVEVGAGFLVEVCFRRRLICAARFGRLLRYAAAWEPFNDITGRPRFVGQSNTSFGK